MRLAVATLITLGNALCGFVAIALVLFNGQQLLVPACLLIFVAWVFDLFDGMVARRLGVDGPLGAVLDSLCDVVSFGVLPAVILISAAQSATEQVIFTVAGAFYLSMAIYRLARYTIKAADAPAGAARFWFEGLSSPAAAMCFSTSVLISTPAAVQAVLMVILALLMVSRLPYPDLAKFYISRRLPVWSLAIPLAALAINWRAGIAAILAFYVCLGVAVAGWRVFRAGYWRWK
jgi:CDP-diacylglycerol--serine O-phosphatidyltransferase